MSRLSFVWLVLSTLAVPGVVTVLAAQDPGAENRKKDPAITPRFDVFSADLSQDGKYLAAGGGLWDQPGEVGVWDFTTREPLKRYAEDRGIASVAFSRDGKLLATGGWDGQVRLRDWANDKEVAVFPVAGVVRVAFAPDGKILASATENATVQLWDVGERKLSADLDGDLVRFHCVTFSRDGKRVLAGGGNWGISGQVTIWDVASQKQVCKLVGHTNSVLCIAFSRDGKTIATGGVDNTIRLWNADTGAPLTTLIGHTHWVEGLVFLSDNKTLSSGSQDGTVRFWDLNQKREREQERIVLPGIVRHLSFTPDGKNLLVGGDNKSLKIIDAASHKELAALWSGQVQPEWEKVPIVAANEKTGSRGWLAAAVLVCFVTTALGVAVCAVAIMATRRRTNVANQKQLG